MVSRVDRVPNKVGIFYPGDVEGRIETVNDPDDPALVRLIRDMTAEMLPSLGNGFPAPFPPWPQEFAW